MRLGMIAVVCIACATLNAQWEPLQPSPIRAPEASGYGGEAAFGYDTNVRLQDEDRVASTFLAGNTGADGVIELSFGRLFGSAKARGRWPFADPIAATWHAGMSAGGSFSALSDQFFVTFATGAAYERRWAYEIFGPQTYDDKLRRAIYDMRTDLRAQSREVVLEARLWTEYHDFSEDDGGRFWDPSFSREETTDPVIPQRSLDFVTAGAWVWFAWWLTKGVGLGPYGWADGKWFIEQRSLAFGIEQSGPMFLTRWQAGTRLAVDSKVVDFEGGLHFRMQLDSGGGTGLDYYQWGWSIAMTVDVSPVRLAASLDVWWREYSFGVAYEPDDPGPPGMAFAGGAGPTTLTFEFGLRARTEAAFELADFLTLAVWYAADQWDASEMADLDYRQQEVGISLAFRW